MEGVGCLALGGTGCAMGCALGVGQSVVVLVLLVLMLILFLGPGPWRLGVGSSLFLFYVRERTLGVPTYMNTGLTGRGWCVLYIDTQDTKIRPPLF